MHLDTSESTSRPRRAARSRWAAFGAAVAVTAGASGGLSLVGAADEAAAGYTAVTPCRLIDTRAGDFNVGPRSAPFGREETDTVAARGANGQCVAAQLPATATALALNVTAVGATADSFVTFWPDGDQPNASSLNPAPGQPPVPNAVITPLSASGTFEVFNNRGNVDLIIDVVGYFTEIESDFVTASEQQDELDNLLNVITGTGSPVKNNTENVAELRGDVDAGAPLDGQVRTVSRSDFRPINLGGGNSVSAGPNRGAYIPAGASNNQLWAPVHLPVGATITTMNVTLRDNSSANLDVDLIVDGASVASIESSGSSTSTGILGAGPDHTVVAGQIIEVRAQGIDGNWSTAGADLEIIEVAIVYDEEGS